MRNVCGKLFPILDAQQGSAGEVLNCHVYLKKIKNGIRSPTNNISF